MAFTTPIRSNLELHNDNDNTSDDNIYDDALAKTYKTLHLKWT